MYFIVEKCKFILAIFTDIKTVYIHNNDNNYNNDHQNILFSES